MNIEMNYHRRVSLMGSLDIHVRFRIASLELFLSKKTTTFCISFHNKRSVAYTHTHEFFSLPVYLSTQPWLPNPLLVRTQRQRAEMCGIRCADSLLFFSQLPPPLLQSRARTRTGRLWPRSRWEVCPACSPPA